MTKLEQKLKELGYEYASPYGYYCRFKNDYVMRYKKYMDEDYLIIIDLDFKTETKIVDCYILLPMSILRQKDIDNLQQSFNEMQKDLEELRKYEIRD